MPEYTELPTKFFPVAGRSVTWKSIAPLRSAGPFDLIILEQAVRNLETYRLIASRRPIAFWGHGRTYTQDNSSAQESLKRWVTRRGSWFFAYTEGGADSVAAFGYPRDRISVVNNSIDSSRLSQQLDEVTDLELQDFTQLHDLRGMTALFLGGLDSSKRPDFLIQAAKIVHSRIPNFRLLIGGDGSSRDAILDAERSTTFVKYLGPLESRAKATALRASEVLAMPGRVGLVAVDSFASRRPIITTSWPWHAPEFEYLNNGENALVTEDDVDSYADGMVRVLTNDSLLNQYRIGCVRSADLYSIKSMSRLFLAGVRDALEV